MSQILQGTYLYYKKKKFIFLSEIQIYIATLTPKDQVMGWAWVDLRATGVLLMGKIKSYSMPHSPS